MPARSNERIALHGCYFVVRSVQIWSYATSVMCGRALIQIIYSWEHLVTMQATRDKKAEAPVGEKIRSSKLSAEQVSRIKTLLAQGRMYMTELAREYGVTAATIARIARELSWRHVQAAPVETAELDASPADHAKQESTTPDNEL